MKKVNVIGTTGSGKSTVSKQLAQKLSCSYIEMDQLFWKADWLESNENEFRAKVTAAIAGERWVLDGNFSRTNDIKLQRVDTIIWVDYSYSRTLLQLLKRTIIRAFSRQELWPATGNSESFKRSFFSSKSILLWFFKNYWHNKRRYSELMTSQQIRHIEFVHLNSPKEARQFIERIV